MKKKGATVLYKVLYFITLVLMITLTNACTITAQGAEKMIAPSIPTNPSCNRWDGFWQLDSRNGNLILYLCGHTGGTLAATNVPRFGTSPVPLTDFSTKGDTISFLAFGADGNPVWASLKYNKDKTKLSGWALHVGKSVWFELRLR